MAWETWDKKEEGDKMTKLDFGEVKKGLEFHGKKELAEMVKSQQVLVYTMCGGGYLGNMAATQPKIFYIDDRVCRLPYPRRKIYQAVKVLCTMLEVSGGEKSLQFPKFHASGIF